MPFPANLPTVALHRQSVCMSADMRSEVQGGDQASRDEGSSGSDSHASVVEDGSSHGGSIVQDGSPHKSSESDPSDDEIDVQHDEDVQSEELAARRDRLASFAAAVGRHRNI